jgi:short-subunit dehydrogenase
MSPLDFRFAHANKNTNNMMNIVITGGSKGMGKAMAEKFAAKKNNIFICSRNEKKLTKSIKNIQVLFNIFQQIFLIKKKF